MEAFLGLHAVPVKNVSRGAVKVRCRVTDRVASVAHKIWNFFPGNEVKSDRFQPSLQFASSLHMLVEEGEHLFRTSSEVVVAVLKVSGRIIDPKQLLADAL